MYKVIGGDQTEYGPATLEEIQQWISEGRLSGQSMARRQDSEEWMPLASFSEFGASLRAQAAQFLANTATALASDDTPAAPAPNEPRIRIGSCLQRSGELLIANLGILVPACGLAWLLSMICQFTPLFGGLLYIALYAVLYGGLYIVYLKRIRDEPTSVSEVFAGFSEIFTQLVLVGFVTALLSSLGMIFCLVPWLYLQVAWVFSVPLVADQRMDFWSAMERSRKKVNRVWFPMLGLLVLAFMPTILMRLFTQAEIFAQTYPAVREMAAAGQPTFNQWLELMTEVAKRSMPMVYLNKLILLVNLPFAVGAIMFAYEDLFGARARKS